MTLEEIKAVWAEIGCNVRWETERETDYWWHVIQRKSETFGGYIYIASGAEEPHAKAIAAAPEHIEWLVARVEELEDRIKRLALKGRQ